MARAAVLTGVGEPLEVAGDVEIERPHAGEVMVRMAASGVCHSDLSCQNGTMPAAVPMVLGHEGAGVVEAVGDGVTAVAPGDHVVISWVPQCGRCFYCGRGQPHLCEEANVAMATGGLLDGTTRLRWRGQPLRQMAGSGTFSEVSIVPATGVVRIPADVELNVAALLGCAVLTGTGAALNTAPVAPGDTVAVVGCGGVGLNVIQGATIAGAERIIGVDVHATKLALAEEFGATHTVDAGAGDPVSAVMSLTGERGADVAFEVIGLQQTIDQAIVMTRRGGRTVLVGVPPMDVAVAVPAFFGLVMADKTVRGCWYGSSDVRRDIPRLIGLYRDGRLKLDQLISRTITLDQVNDAFDAMKTGEIARSVITY
jgi:NDMA-dependent alcohol dehydrogenase